MKLQKDIDGLGSWTRNCQMHDDAADKKAKNSGFLPLSGKMLKEESNTSE